MDSTGKFILKYIIFNLKTKCKQILHEGIYYFGGKDDEGREIDTLRILKTDQKPMCWIFP